MKQRGYLVYDVFTTTALAGNPLAIVMDCDGLDVAGMQAIAREFNLSETVFVLPPENPLHRAKIRIFTPSYEMPFAGHPTVGSAIALSELTADNGAAGIFVLEENIGLVRCAVSRRDGQSFAEFDLPRLPERLQMTADAAAVGAALGLRPDEIGFENHRVSLWSAGVPYVTVPVAGLEAAAKASLEIAAWLEIAPKRPNDVAASAYVYCRESINHESSFHARMFVGENPTYEDPATGSAAAAFAGAVNHFDRPVDGRAVVWIEQGVEMGRPSRIRLELDIEAGAIDAARIGGHAVKVAEGMLLG
jgi:trans-2,3-dihydro-3-hydroxyanthranilate isomerase